MIGSLIVEVVSRDVGPHRGFDRTRHPRLWLLLVLGGLLVAGVVLLTLWLSRRPSARSAGVMPPAAAPSPTANAEAILAERLARSQITPDDYRSLLAALRGAPAPAAAPAAPPADAPEA